MFCKKCGRELEEGAKFCDECGTRVEVIYEPEERGRKKAYEPIGSFKEEIYEPAKHVTKRIYEPEEPVRKEIREPVKSIRNGRRHKKTAGINGYQAGVIGASLLMALSAFLPFWEILFEPMAYILGFDTIYSLKVGNMIGSGVFVLIFAVVIILSVCFEKRLPVLIFSVLSLFIYCVFLWGQKMSFESIETEMWEYIGLEYLLSEGIGYYLWPVSVIALIITCILYIVPKKER